MRLPAEGPDNLSCSGDDRVTRQLLRLLPSGQAIPREDPFLTIGAPFIDSEELIEELNTKNIKGVNFNSTSFTPADMKGKALNPKFKGIKCNGIKISVTSNEIFKPVEFGIYLIYSLLQLYSDYFKFNEQHFDRLAGTDKLRIELLSGKDPTKIIEGWQPDVEKFKSKRKNFLLY